MQLNKNYQYIIGTLSPLSVKFKITVYDVDHNNSTVLKKCEVQHKNNNYTLHLLYTIFR